MSLSILKNSGQLVQEFIRTDISLNGVEAFQKLNWIEAHLANMLPNSPVSPSISVPSSITLPSTDSIITPTSVTSNSSFPFSPLSPVSPQSHDKHNGSPFHEPIKHVKKRHAVQRTAKPAEMGIANIRLISPYLNNSLLSMILSDIMVMYFNETISAIKKKYNKSKIKIRFNGQNAIRFSFIVEKDKLPEAIRETLLIFKNLYFEQEIYASILEMYCVIIDAMKENAVIVYPQSVTFKDLVKTRKKISFQKMITQYQNIFRSACVNVSASNNINKAGLFRITDKYLRNKITHIYSFKEMLSNGKQWFI
eukprot:19944_1